MKEVKLIIDDQSSKECLTQLNQEIALLSELSHPNIVQYCGSELGTEKLSVYLEYVSGGSIHKLLGEYGSFKEPVIRAYTRQILCGLAYLHRRNTAHRYLIVTIGQSNSYEEVCFTHQRHQGTQKKSISPARDIKGPNILVDSNGEIKLVDFGMAKHVIMNTSGYSLAVDIWSLGCTILEMATSKPPWSQYEGQGFSRNPDNLSADAQSFIKLCLQRDPIALPTAVQLLQHPFIQEQSMVEAAKINLVDEASTSLHGRKYMAASASDLYSDRTRISTQDRDHRIQPISRTRLLKSSWNEISITSIPESPCSNSVEQCKSACGSCLHASYQPTF
ncbi:Protein kinase domain - like 10 [Theobroma cacao]|nr:Protein kinase domain - like 10 [Theobroma cacao]